MAKLYVSAPTSVAVADSVAIVLGRYSNTFITNLLNRAYVTKSRREQENRTVEHISLPFAHASRGTESSHENSSIAGGLDRDALVCPSQKALTPDKRSTV